MKLFGALIFSLLIHSLVIQWKPMVDPEITGSAGQAVLNIQHMRFVTAMAEPLSEDKTEGDDNEQNNEIEEQLTDIEVEAVIEPSDEKQVETIEPPPAPKEIGVDKKMEVIDTLEKKNRTQPAQKQETKTAKNIKSEAEIKIDVSKKERKPVEKQDIESAIKEEFVTEVEIEEVEVTEITEPAKIEIVVTQQETTVAVDVVSTTDTVAENSGFDQIPTMEKPRYRKAFPPKYPRLAKKRGQQGLVLLRAKVDQQGEIETIEVLKSSGFKSLDTRALETVEQWLFYPYKVANEPTVAWVNIPVDFTLR